MPDELTQAIESATRLIVESTYVVALVGAGLSAESGIPTFRGPGGLWTRIGEPSMNGYQEFLADPSGWWKQQQEQQADPDRSHFREAIEKAEPNAGHYALAELEELGILKMTITQNVDNLHYIAGSKQVMEIHGNRTKLRCIGCEARWHRHEFEIGEFPPECPECGDLVKSDTVMFGEPIPRSVLERCFDEVELCDCIIVVGTSATVYPAASFPQTVKERGGLMIEFNPNETPLSSISDAALRCPTGESLPGVVKRIKESKGF